MDVWMDRGRPSLFAALEQVCDRIENDLKAAIDIRESHDHAIIECERGKTKNAAEDVERLERENRKLQQELTELRTKLNQSTPAARKDAPSRFPLADISPNRTAGVWVDNAGSIFSPTSPEATHWKRECTKITNKYTLLNDRYKQLAEKAREFRDRKDGWLKYAEMLEKKVEKLEKKLKEKEASTIRAAGTEQQPDPATGSGIYGKAALNASFISDPESGSGTSETQDGESLSDPKARRAASMPPADASQHEAHVAQETAVDTRGGDELPSLPPSIWNEQAVKIKEEPSSDGPIVVSERSLRKRKHAGDENEMPPPSRKIKSEPHASSDPIVTGEAAAFSPHESIDLDDEQVGMPTPRKQRPLWMQTLRGGEEVTPGPRIDNIARSLFARPLLDTPPITPTLGRDIVGHSTFTEQLRSKIVKSSRNIDWRLATGVADLAEDDSEASEFPELSGASNVSRAPISTTGSRLQTLLNQLTPQSDVSPQRPISTGMGIHATRPSSKDVESPLEDRRREKVSARNNGQATPVPRLRQGNDRFSKKSPRLRETPLAQLSVSDFKVNPKLNNGQKFAFDEVVRNKADRTELEGCTDYNCCGRHYRALAESELSARGPSALSCAEDIKMMEEYLGGGAHKLVDMTGEERSEVWIRAKSQGLANRIGKHRHRFARQASPPGYWNPDFPSTQEIEQNREESARRERKQVEERWREAMKTGGTGKWLFRDE
ncbi:DNA repair protein endonuclease SAE2/CtIP C-terminus-domain-containing protein [Cladorrhinum sp. PSN259]|nr:DNA repair protein endonuclease SAE2/CtIP C-terminus-domain-containing protein [Cladorrhinum sp. PSN259]